MKIEKIKINKLKPAKYNPRQISKKQYNDLKDSVVKFGLVDPIILNKDFTVIGGHQRLKVCKELKYKDIDCVILDLTKQEERELNIRLNKSGGEFDMDILANEFEIEELKDWGFKEIELGLNIDKIGENPYTKKIDAPEYTPSDNPPTLDMLNDKTKRNELINNIKKSNVSEQEKDFLLEAANRHIIFDYSKIADYYANASEEMQELMESSALVIIDFNKAIEGGYVKLSNEITDQYIEEYGS